MKAIFLGTGTSVGVPQIGCTCQTCTSTDPRDRRTRPSMLLRTGSANILIDAGPDFRAQMLAHGIRSVDAILITHAHADHILGLNDLTAMNARAGVVPKLYAHPSAIETIQKVFFYAFSGYNGVSSIPRFEVLSFGDAAFEVCGVQVDPIPVEHAGEPCYGFRFGTFAYVTDAKQIPPASMTKLGGLDTLVLNSLRFSRHHPSHYTVEGALEVISDLKPRQAWLTHMGHEVLHARDNALLPEGVAFAYDGLELDMEGR